MAATPLCTEEVSAACLHRWMEGERISRLIALSHQADRSKQQKMVNQSLPIIIDPATTFQRKSF